MPAGKRAWQPERLLYRWLSFDLLARLANRTGEADRQFTNAVGLEQFDGLLGDELGTGATIDSGRF